MKRSIPEGVGFDEGLLVANDVRAFDRGQDSDLIECVLLLFIGEIVHFDFFEGINLSISQPLDFIDAGVGSLT